MKTIQLKSLALFLYTLLFSLSYAEEFNYSVTDCQGHTYPVVKIGNQYWMAENLQCTKYDTQSERAGAMLLTSTYSPDYPYYDAPYYTDGRNISTSDSGNLTYSQRKKLGLLYNWAAAVALSTMDEAKNRNTPFSGKRQGICPNGWHIPTDAEWDTLKKHIGINIGGKLKAASGWHENGNGTDDYSFAALPAGYSYGGEVFEVGSISFFWTASPRDSNNAYDRVLLFKNDELKNYDYGKWGGHSIRCVKD